MLKKLSLFWRWLESGSDAVLSSFGVKEGTTVGLMVVPGPTPENTSSVSTMRPENVSGDGDYAE